MYPGAVTRLIDIGVNLTSRQFTHDLDEVIARGVEAGVSQMIVTGTSLTTSEAAATLATRFPGQLYATAGIHPHGASAFRSEAETALEALAAKPEVVAIGECGLDFNRDYSPRPEQERCFEAQLDLATRLNIPVFLHERDAHARFINILGRYRDKLPAVVVHCFTGSAEALRSYLELDCHIGITGWICDERRGLGLRELVAQIPSDRLMIETDAPWLTPRNIRPKPKRNEPMYLPYVAREVAACTGRSVDEVAADSTATAIRFFGLPSSPSAPRP